MDPGDLTHPYTCVADLRDLAPNYVSALPIDPHGAGWDADSAVANLFLGNNNTGYYVHRSDAGRIRIGSCHPERVDDISVQR